MRIALVNPVEAGVRGYQNIGGHMPQLGLQVLARLTPSDHQVDIIDEGFGQAKTKQLLNPNRYDLVGVTAYTSQAARAYEIAQWCRQQKITCIMGGPHAWAVPDEAAQYFDAVVVGEADLVWPQVLADVQAGCLQPRYEGELADLSQGYGGAEQTLDPINGKYDVGAIQTSRGCPVGCEYCSVTAFNGARIRRRSIDQIIEEWNSISRRFVFVVDDNFFGVTGAHGEWAKELLRQIIARGKKHLWFSQTTINMGGDPEAVKLAYQAGCRGMLVGLESFNTQNLKLCNKGINRKHNNYGELVEGFHRGGISVFGAFIVGADHDDENTVADTLLEAVNIGVDIIQITKLTPLPRTKMFDKFIADGRIFANQFPQDWRKYNFTDTVYYPQGMTPRELDESTFELRYAAAKYPWVLRRSLRTLWKTRSLTTAAFVHQINKGFVTLARARSAMDTAEQGFREPVVNERLSKIRRAMAVKPWA